MSYRGVGHVIFSLHLGVGHSILLQLEGVGHVFSNHHMLRPTPPPPLYFLTSPLFPGTSYWEEDIFQFHLMDFAIGSLNDDDDAENDAW